MTSAATEVAFSTSGHTGSPTIWLRTQEQLYAEVELIAGELLGDVDQVVSFAPRKHLFGKLFGDVFTEYVSIPVHYRSHDPIGLPSLAEGKRTLFVCLPASWLVLRHMLRQIRALPQAVALHGTGPTVRATGEVLAALADTNFRAIELFGATETGGIAYRRALPPNDGQMPWTLLSDVEFADPASGTRQRLHVRSPRIARRADMTEAPASWCLPDIVSRVNDRSFNLEGRASALIKINGKRCDLEELASALRDVTPGVDVACMPVHDPVRAEHYELFYSVEEGDVGSQQIMNRLRDAVTNFTPPRAVHRVPQIPRTSTGKIAVTALYALLEDATHQRPETRQR